MYDIICLTGHRKGGTTMFHKLFEGHPELTVYPDDISLLYAYFPCFADKKKYSIDEISQRIEKILISIFINLKKSSKSNQDLPEIDLFLKYFWKYLSTKDIFSRGDVICGVADAWHKSLNLIEKKPFLFKETSQAIHFEEIKDCIPSCKFINLVRDPRDNYAAIKSGVKKYYSKMGEGEMASLSSLINRARMDMLSAKTYLETHPDNFYALRFEDLTAKPEYEMKKVADFVGVKFDQCLLQPTTFGQSFSGNSHEGSQFVGISSKNVGKWKERISDFEAKVIEFWLGDVMDSWGYERTFSQTECTQAFAEFYKWYNCQYFFYDSFETKNEK